MARISDQRLNDAISVYHKSPHGEAAYNINFVVDSLKDLKDCRVILADLLERMAYDFDDKPQARNFMEYTQSDMDKIAEVLRAQLDKQQ